MRDALSARAPGDRSAAVRALVDVVAVEVDGVDIAAGRTEGPLASGVLALLAGVARLASGAGHASVPFEEGAVELVLHRRGGSALLSVVTLSRPARVLAHDVEVDLALLGDALRAAAADFCRRVAEVAPGAGSAPEIRRLLRMAARRASMAAATPGRPSAGARRSPRRPRDPACSFEIHDEDGRLAAWRGPGADLASLLVRGRISLRAAAGTEIASVEGSPFLLFRDLCAGAARIAASHGAPVAFELARPGRRATLHVSLERGAVTVDGRRPQPCDPLALAQAILEGAADFCAVVRARAPGQSGNVLLVDLDSAARTTLAQVREARAGDRAASGPRRLRVPPAARRAVHPLATGSLRRVSFRRVAIADVGPPAGAALLREGELVLCCGRAATVGLDRRGGDERWRGPGAEQAVLAGEVLVLLAGGRLRGVDPGSGAERWSRASSAPGPAAALVATPGPRALLLSGDRIECVDAVAGEEAWSFTSPGALRLSALPFGALTVVAADTGMVHALDREGRVAWRLRGAGALCAPAARGPRVCLLTFATRAGAVVTGVDVATGRRSFEAPLDFSPVGEPVPFAGRIAVAGLLGGDGLVTALEEDGSRAWTEPSPAVGAAALAPRPGGLLVKGADGTCAALDRNGQVAWLRAPAGSPAPPGNLPPVAVRGLVVVPAEEVDVLDGRTGMAVGHLPAHAPARLLVDEELGAWTMDAEGLVTGARMRGHLAVVLDPSAAPGG
jgi:outer membrane protein assembly factor BamB